MLICIPVFNDIRIIDLVDFIGSSVVEDRIKNIKLLICDDASNPPITCSDFNVENDLIKIITHKKNLGLPAARNTLLEGSIGHNVFFLDSDDCLTKEFLNWLSFIDNNIGPNEVFYHPAELIGDRKGHWGNVGPAFRYWAFLTNRICYSIFFKNSGRFKYDENLRSGFEDWAFNLELILNGFEFKMGKKGFRYRVSSTGMLQSQSLDDYLSITYSLLHLRVSCFLRVFGIVDHGIVRYCVGRLIRCWDYIYYGARIKFRMLYRQQKR